MLPLRVIVGGMLVTVVLFYSLERYDAVLKAAAITTAVTTARAESTRKHTSPDSLYVVHWTHVPKAAGTAMAALARRIACVKNWAALGDANPCCVPELCAVKARCFSSAGTCLLVQGIGMHTNSMDRAAAVPCCGGEWVGSTAPVAARLSLRKREREEDEEIARGYADWPLARRIEFFARLGVDNLPSWMAGDTRVKMSVIVRKQRPLPLSSTTKEAWEAQDACYFNEENKGSHSMTMLRHPVSRSISAFFYRGHNPNYDVFRLRPGSWLPPHVQDSGYRLVDYLPLDEYTNILVKLFGDDRCKSGSPDGQVSACHTDAKTQKKKGACACAVIQQGCHAYHNSSGYLTKRHVALATRSLKEHAFFGFLEAYTTSVLLVGVTFGIEVSEADFSKQRSSSSTLERRCSPSKAMRRDGDACRAAFEANKLDVDLYERAHRIFCERVKDAGLLLNPIVEEELAEANFCGPHRFDDPDHVCGLLENPTGQAELHETRYACRRATGPEWWLEKHGFHADVSNRRPKQNTNRRRRRTLLDSKRSRHNNASNVS